MFEWFYHFSMQDKQGKTTRDFNSVHAHTLKVNKLKTTAYPFQPARVSDDCAGGVLCAFLEASDGSHFRCDLYFAYILE